MAVHTDRHDARRSFLWWLTMNALSALMILAIALTFLLIMAEMDRQKREAGTDRWRPSLWQHSV